MLNSLMTAYHSQVGSTGPALIKWQPMVEYQHDTKEGNQCTVQRFFKKFCLAFSECLFIRHVDERKKGLKGGIFSLWEDKLSKLIAASHRNFLLSDLDIMDKSNSQANYEKWKKQKFFSKEFENLTDAVSYMLLLGNHSNLELLSDEPD